MTETKYYCDHCKKEMNANVFNNFGIEVGVSKKYKVDLCVLCAQELADIIEEFVSSFEGEDEE